MFGVELIAALFCLGAIALAYFVFNYSLREKTFEEALAEQRSESGESGKNQKKDKSKKHKKKLPAGSAPDVSPKKASAKVPQSSEDEAYTSKFAAVKPESKKSKKTSESSAAEETHAKLVVTKKTDLPALPPPAERKPSRTSESDVTVPTTVKKPALIPAAPKVKKETEKKVSESKDDHLVSKENREEKTSTTTKIHEAVRKPNVVQLELIEDGHLNAIPNPLPKKEVKPQKSLKLVPAVVQKTAPPPKKPLAVVAANGLHHTAGASEYNEVLGLLKTVQLSDAETQNLLQVLIVKQSERHTEWVQLGKGKSADPATIAKHLMADKERELHDEKQMNKALLDQLKDLKSLLTLEKGNLRQVTESSRQSSDKVSVLEQQLKSVNSRLKDAQDKQSMEVAQLMRRVQEAENRAANVIVLEEENRKLQQKTIGVDDTEFLSKELESVRAERDQLTRELQANQKKVLELQEKNQLSIQTETHVRSAESEAEVQAIQRKMESAQENEKIAAQGREALEKKVVEMTSDLAKTQDEIEHLVRQLEETQSRSSELQHSNTTLLTTVEKLKQTIQHEHTEDSHMQKEIQELQKKLEHVSKERDGFEEAKKAYEVKIEETRDRHREVIHRLFPSIRLEKSLNSEKWLQEFERKAAETLQKDDSQSRAEFENVQKLTSQLTDMQDAQNSLQAEVEKYRTTLSHTEEKLRQLEESVQSEEEKWELVGQTAKEHEHKWKHLETQLSEVLGEKQSVQKLLEERSSSVGEIEHRLMEAEERLRSFSHVQAELDSLREEADRLKGDLGLTRRDKDNLAEEAGILRRTLAEASHAQAEADKRAASFLTELNELRNKSDSLDTLHREAVDLRQALDVEKDNAKKMAQELLRSRSLIQVGLESLRKEEETVSKLREALEARENGLNGAANALGDTAHR